MTFCVNPFLRKNFTLSSCECLSPCRENTPEASLVQYGKYNYRHTKQGSRNTSSVWIAAVAYLADTRNYLIVF